MRLPATAARCGALFALAAAAYAGSIPAELVQDDYQVLVENPVVRGAVPLREAFLRDYWGRTATDNVPSYRPLPVLIHAAEWRGGAPWIFHLVNVLVHAAVGVALYLAARALAGESVALVAAAFFSVFAAPSEAVQSGVGLADLLLALFSLAGLAAHRRAGRGGAALAAGAFALALASKETAVAAPLAWLAIDLLFPAAGPRRLRFAGYAAVLALYLTLRRAALGGLLQRGGNELFQPFLHADLPARLLGAGKIFAQRYLPGLIDPARRLYACSQPACGLAGANDALAWLGLAALAAIFAAPFLLRRRAPAVAAGLAWFALFFLPVSNLILPGTVMYAERLLYAPSAGLALALAAALAMIRRRGLGYALLAALALGNLAADQVRNVEWRRAETLYLSALPIAPDSATVQCYAGIAHVQLGDAAAAEADERRALALWPDYPEARSVLGSALEMQGRLDEAEREYRASFLRRPSAEMAAPYARFLLRRGRRGEALQVLRLALRSFPDSPRLRALERELQPRSP